MSPVRLLVTSAAFGSSVCSATAAAPLSPEEAASHVGETTTVRGVVASAEHDANEQNTQPPGVLGGSFAVAVGRVCDQRVDDNVFDLSQSDTTTPRGWAGHNQVMQAMSS
jgi:hypothetical protein